MPTAQRKNHLAFAASAILAAAVICYAPPAPAQAVVPPQAESFPLTYGEWGARWWQYVIGIPADQNPLFDATGARKGRQAAEATRHRPACRNCVGRRVS